MIVDFIGAAYWTKNLASLAVDGRMIMLGLMGGKETVPSMSSRVLSLTHRSPLPAGNTVPEAQLSQILYKRLRIQGSTLRARSVEYQAALIAR